MAPFSYRRLSLTAPRVAGSCVVPRRGFTLIEMLVVIAILVVLAAILLPVLIGAREVARQTHCASNLQQIGRALESYVDDHDGCYPPGQVQPRARDDEKDEGVGDWEDAIQPYVKNDPLYRCPDDPSPAEFFEKSYALNGSFIGLPESAVTYPAATILAADQRNTLQNLDRPAVFNWWRWQGNVWPPCWSPDPTPAAAEELALERHTGRFNALFADGHVRPIRFRETWGAGPANQYWPQRPGSLAVAQTRLSIRSEAAARR
jgi:prepilin-type N-terminal cleavage/methylation domain-containing protein/prepilin-type processing-associated H-X9-DG protein